LFKHMRYLMFTSVPAMLVAMTVYLIVGLFNHSHASADASELLSALHSQFVTSPHTLLIPAITLGMIICRVPTLITLAISAFLGFIGIFIFQPQLALSLKEGLVTVWQGHELSTGHEMLDSLVSTTGILGMLPTVQLVLSAMIFGAAMIGTGMLARITRSITNRLHKRTSIVGATVGSGLFMNSCTADQYLSLIVTGNMYRNVYRRFRLEPRLLSRTIEDSVSVTSVLIPWNSCGITQATVLGVATLIYFPFCIFNYLSPCMSILLAWTGLTIPKTVRENPIPITEADK
ncbi:MAG: sodium:proton antiporter, partial [Duncaniella sp.]|nr:sodium:proton antiporter [Duncaniella sp.]